jgi:hypothetical protein
MRTPPPGSKNTMPKRPGESKTDYLARVNATKNTKPVRSGNDTPDPGIYGGVKAPRGTSPLPPPPPKPRSPVKPVPPKPRTPVRPDRPTMPPKPTTPVRPPKPRPGEPLPGGGRGTAAAPGYGGGKPVTIRPGTIKPKGGAGTGGGRGTAAAPGYGGGKPRRMMSGGMVKGKKK